MTHFRLRSTQVTQSAVNPMSSIRGQILVMAAAFTVSQISGGVLVFSIVYRTHASPAGSLTIISIDRADSTVAGRFAFEAALTPDTAPHRHVSGTFRLRLGFVPVYTIP